MGILLKLKNANWDISVIIGDLKNLLSIFSVKSARLISFTTLASLLATRMYLASNLTRRLAGLKTNETGRSERFPGGEGPCVKSMFTVESSAWIHA